MRGSLDKVTKTMESVVDDNAAKMSGALSLKTQLIRFIISGGISAVVDLGLLYILKDFGGLTYAAAKSFSFIAGTTTAYMINRRWTFAAAPSKRRFIAILVLYALTFIVQVGLSTFTYSWFISLDIRENLATVASFVIGQGVATIVNFIIQRGIIFKADGVFNR